MKHTDQRTNELVDAYNAEVGRWHFESITMGSLQRPRVSLRDKLKGDDLNHANDNQPKGE